MTFAYTWVLLLVIIPVVLCVWMLQRRVWGVAVPFDHRDHQPRRTLGALLRFFELIPLLLLIVVLIIIARPQVQRIPREERVLNNILICMDVSASMTTDNRYEMAKKAMEEFIDTRQGDALGFTLFGTQQIRWTPLTKDIATIKRALPFANPRNQPPFMGGTMIGAALRFCRDNMVHEAPEGDRLLLLVSDGMSADVNSGNSSELADEMKAANITIYHIHVGTDPTPADVSEIANSTGGESFVATDAGGLKRIFKHIDRMKPARFKPATAIPMDFYQPFALIGLCLLAAYGVGAYGLRYSPW
jgi:Ca-activated chloride channel homolog